MMKSLLVTLTSNLFILAFVGGSFGAFTCPNGGIFADPDDCSQFYQCRYNGEPGVRFVCPSGTLFSDELLVCDHAGNVDCGTRPINPDSGTTSTTLPSSTASTTSPKTSSTTSSSTKSSTSSTTESTSSSTTTSTSASTTSSSSTTTKTTTSSTSSSPTTSLQTVSPGLPKRSIVFYLALTGKAEPNYQDDTDWQPLLYPYQQTGANVLILTFINPETMVVPKAFQNLMRTKGTGLDGSVPKDTKVLFSIGGQTYSRTVNPWPWLTSQVAAESMAVEVAQWPQLYGCDGVDVDIEDGAGHDSSAGVNLGHFVRKLKELNPDIIINLPVYGWPQIPATNAVVNQAWNVGGTSNGMIDAIGIMWYVGTESLIYVDNYAHGSTDNKGITVDVPTNAIMVGVKGTASESTIMSMASELESRDLAGMIVWFSSVRGGFSYDVTWDTSKKIESQEAFTKAMAQLRT